MAKRTVKLKNKTITFNYDGPLKAGEIVHIENCVKGAYELAEKSLAILGRGEGEEFFEMIFGEADAFKQKKAAEAYSGILETMAGGLNIIRAKQFVNKARKFDPDTFSSADVNDGKTIRIYDAFFKKHEGDGLGLNDRASVIMHECAHLAGCTGDTEQDSPNSAECLRNFTILACGIVKPGDLFSGEDYEGEPDKDSEIGINGDLPYNKDQPRAPKGSPIGGQWVTEGGDGGGGESSENRETLDFRRGSEDRIIPGHDYRESDSDSGSDFSKPDYSVSISDAYPGMDLGTPNSTGDEFSIKGGGSDFVFNRIGEIVSGEMLSELEKLYPELKGADATLNPDGSITIRPIAKGKEFDGITLDKMPGEVQTVQLSASDTPSRNEGGDTVQSKEDVEDQEKMPDEKSENSDTPNSDKNTGTDESNPASRSEKIQSDPKMIEGGFVMNKERGNTQIYGAFDDVITGLEPNKPYTIEYVGTYRDYVDDGTPSYPDEYDPNIPQKWGFNTVSDEEGTIKIHRQGITNQTPENAITGCVGDDLRGTIERNIRVGSFEENYGDKPDKFHWYTEADTENESFLSKGSVSWNMQESYGYAAYPVAHASEGVGVDPKNAPIGTDDKLPVLGGGITGREGKNTIISSEKFEWGTDSNNNKSYFRNSKGEQISQSQTPSNPNKKKGSALPN